MGLKRILVFFLVIVLLGIFSVYYPQIREEISITGDSAKAEYSPENAVLLRVIDGDTLEVLFEGSEEKESIRMLGINAPEKKMPMSNESKEFLEQFVNKTIYLQRDKEDEDKYYRKLRYAFYDNRMLNLELLELGLVNAYIIEDLAYKDKILRAEAQARNFELGIWKKSSEACAVQDCINLIELNASEEFFVIGNICSFDCSLEGWFAKNSGRSSFWLDPMKAGEAREYSSEILNREVWNDFHDNFFIFDKSGELVLYFEY